MKKIATGRSLGRLKLSMLAIPGDGVHIHSERDFRDAKNHASKPHIILALVDRRRGAAGGAASKAREDF